LGLFCYPFAEAVWGAPGLQTVVLFDLANQGVLLIACYLAFWVRLPRHGAETDQDAHSGGGNGGSLLHALGARLLNPCLVALYGAAALRLAGVDALPPVAQALAAPLAAANKPLALLALGVLLDLRPPRGQLATVAAVLVRRRGGGGAGGRMPARTHAHMHTRPRSPIRNKRRADDAAALCAARRRACG
jgi:predicted permease